MINGTLTIEIVYLLGDFFNRKWEVKIDRKKITKIKLVGIRVIKPMFNNSKILMIVRPID